MSQTEGLCSRIPVLVVHISIHTVYLNITNAMTYHVLQHVVLRNDYVCPEGAIVNQISYPREMGEEIGTLLEPDELSPFGPEAIRHLPPYRQPHYVRMAIKWALRGAKTPLSASQIADKTGLDPRTIRDELDNLVSRREVERIRHGRSLSTYRLIGTPVGLFSKHLMRLRRRIYTVEQSQSPDGDHFLIVQEREELRKGSYEPVGGIIIGLEDIDEFLTQLRRFVEEPGPTKITGRR